MAQSYVRYVGDGVTQNFNLTFGYLGREHVFVKVNGVAKTVGVDWTWLTSTTIRLTVAAPNGQTVELRRTTPVSTAFVDYQDGSTLGEDELDQSNLQHLYLSQESQDAVNDALSKDSTGHYDATNKRIRNLAAPTAGTDAVTKDYADSTISAAAASASAAAASATAADASADAAAVSQAAAATSAAAAAASQSAAAGYAGGVNLPSVSGQALKMLRVKGDETGYEHRSAAQVRGDISALAAADASVIEAIVKKLQTTTGPTTLTLGAVADGDLLKRSGTDIVGTPSPKSVRKAADETVNNTSTLQNDDELVLALEANKSYRFDCFLVMNGNTSADIKFAFTVPALASVVWGPSGAYTAPDGTSVNQGTKVSGSGTALAVGITGANVIRLTGTVVMGANAGNLQLQWAQNSATVGNTTVEQNSYMRTEAF